MDRMTPCRDMAVGNYQDGCRRPSRFGPPESSAVRSGVTSCEKTLTDTIKLAHPKAAWVQESRLYLESKLSYSQFPIEVRNFSLPWQQGSVWAKLEWHSQFGWPLKPPTRYKYHGHISYASWVIANFMLKSANFHYHGNKGPVSYTHLTLPTNREV